MPRLVYFLPFSCPMSIHRTSTRIYTRVRRPAGLLRFFSLAPLRTPARRVAGFLTTAMIVTGVISPALAAAQTTSGPQTGLPTVALTAGFHVIQAEVANTEDTRRIGLMFRKSLPDNQGMLFVFNTPDVQCFWMRNTLVPLSAAFIANDGTIVNIEDMAPLTETPHCSTRPVRYVLEMAQGWFQSHGIQPGQSIGGISTK